MTAVNSLPRAGGRVFGIHVTPLTQRRFANFRANRRGRWSLWIFTALLLISLGAEFVANDKPLLVHYDGRFYFPVVVSYPETDFGGFLETEGTTTTRRCSRSSAT